MSNVLYQPLPDEYQGVKVNTDFQIGIQVSLCLEDMELTEDERMRCALYLLFGNDDGTVRELPEDIEGCFTWFLSGWNHDNKAEDNDKRKVMDFFVDQGRIYADFIQIYGINLNRASMHWWEFCWLLWNMPYKYSSFHQAIEIRTMKPKKGASAEERRAIANAQKVFSLEETPKEYTEQEKQAIDTYDEMMRQIKERKKTEEQALKEFKR